MDFFSQQDKARRNSSLLLLLFVSAVLTLIVITNVLVAVSWLLLNGAGSDGVSNFSALFSWQRFGHISLAVSGTVVCAIVYKWFQLSSGGKAVAESLGGVRINPNSSDSNQSRVLNVVEEMAIASGMPVPPVYLLADERGINAFAAGNTPADAVIGVTFGSIYQLNREQLQGVIAHEFSHILNGDMRLNIRLIALLNGILFIGSIGEILLRSSGFGRRSPLRRTSKRSGDTRVVMLGFGLIIIGWLGGFFGSLIKAAVSRQREFLADASAVQFTRNPQGIADALKIIGGYSPGARIADPHAKEVSHLFFGQALNRLQATFATHPPLAERIQRIEPSWDGQFTRRSSVIPQADFQNRRVPPAGAHEAINSAAMVSAVAAEVLLADAEFSRTVDDIREGIDSLPAGLLEQAHEPFAAMGIAFALLLSDDSKVQEKQLQRIEQQGVAGMALQTVRLYGDMAMLDKPLRMPLLELAMPALKCLSLEQYKSFKKTLLLLIRTDNQLQLFEWCSYQLLRHFLDGEYALKKPGRALYKTIGPVRIEFQRVLSLLALQGHIGRDAAEQAFMVGAETAGLHGLVLLPEHSISLDDFSRAVNKLANCYPLLKPLVLKGLVACARQDGKIAAEEREIIISIAAVLDCPMPRLQ